MKSHTRHTHNWIMYAYTAIVSSLLSTLPKGCTAWCCANAHGCVQNSRTGDCFRGVEKLSGSTTIATESSSLEHARVGIRHVGHLVIRIAMNRGCKAAPFRIVLTVTSRIPRLDHLYEFWPFGTITARAFWVAASRAGASRVGGSICCGCSRWHCILCVVCFVAVSLEVLRDPTLFLRTPRLRVVSSTTTPLDCASSPSEYLVVLPPRGLVLFIAMLQGLLLLP